ncbi:MAG: DUF3999 family protein [Acidobacteriaceae bacterium]
MTLRAPVLLLLAIAASPNVHYFRYQRSVLNTPPQKQQTCLTLDPATFAHSGSQLASLRLYRGETETPYAVNYPAAAGSSPKTIPPLNTGLRNGSTTFDAIMPDGVYSNLDLGVSGKDFIATVHVSGSQTPTQAGKHATNLGAFTIFDFSRQKLGRSTVLHLPQSDFRYLHFRIDGPVRPDQITGLTIGRLPQGQPQYVTVAASSTVNQKGRDSIIEFAVPANVPVDRISFTPGAQPVNFSRDVTVTVAPAAAQPSTDVEQPPLPAVASGNILRIHSTQNGHKIDEEDLAIAAPTWLPANTATRWTVAVLNQDDAPLALQSVSLQMIARNLCFDAEPGATYALYYGDKALSSPHYDYAQLFVPDKNAARAILGTERQNPQFQNRPDTRPFTEKHPALLWIVLIAVILLLASIALRTGRQTKQP